MESAESEEWVTVARAAELVDRLPRQVYRWLDRDLAENQPHRIRRRETSRKTLEIHLPTLRAYADDVPRKGRPRKR